MSADTPMAEPVAAQPETKPAEAVAEKPAETTTTTESKTEEKAESAPAAAEEKKTDEKSEEKPERNGGRFERGRGRGRGRGNGNGNGRFQKRNKNTEFENLPESSDPTEIRQQVEFYFSDVNLSTDKHLFEEIKGAANEPVSIKHIHSFKRMKHFQPYTAIVAALRESKDLEVIEDGKFAGTGNEGIKRKTPLTIPTRPGDEEKGPLDVETQYLRIFNRSKNSMDRSIYVKNFGDDISQVGQIELEDFFRPYGSVMVRKRRNQETGEWKGSVFVEFETEELQQQFLALDPKPKFKDNELTIMSKKDYSKMKCDEKGIVPAWEKDPNSINDAPREKREFRGNQRGGRGGRGRGGRGGRGRGRGGNDRNRERDFDRSNKRKAESDNREDTKKAKVEIKEDA